MPERAVPSRGDPAATARRANASAGECGAKDQVSCSGSPTVPYGVAVVGPTGTGKTALAVAIARHLGRAELVSVDAMAVYRGLDVGTAKPTESERRGLRWHLVDIAEPDEEFSVAEFQTAGRAALAAIRARRNLPILVGGTGLYHRALLDDLELPGRFPEVARALEREAEAAGVANLYERLVALDPTAASRIEPGNRRRVLRALEVSVGSGRRFSDYGPGIDAYPPSVWIQIGLALPRARLDERIAGRLAWQLDHGFVDEARALARRPGSLSRTAAQALGYRELLAWLSGETSYDFAVAEALRRTRAFARRQERWFRRDPRITWLDAEDDGLLGDAVGLVESGGLESGELESGELESDGSASPGRSVAPGCVPSGRPDGGRTGRSRET